MATSKELIDEFVSNHMESVFYFCLKKTGNTVEAEDLTSDIALQILKALQGGTVPTHFHAWMWRIARNRYSRFMASKRRYADATMCEDIEYYDTADPNGDVFRDMEDSEQLALLRRELAFISSDYRDILVAYYFDNRSVKDIAASLSLPEGTVTSRLYRARHLLKEGLTMARTFGVKSYKPEEVRFTSSGHFTNDQPWGTLTHLLYKNIFLEVYGNPQTAKDLALELGIALPYMESELEYLADQTFLTKLGDRYETTFAIISREAQTAIRDHNASIAKELTAKLTALVDSWYAACQAHHFDAFGTYQSYEDAKWALLTLTFDRLFDTAVERKPYLYTARPYGGKWDIIGFQTTDFEPLPFVGHHISSNVRSNLPNIAFGQFKFYHNGINTWTPNSLTHEEAYTLHCVACGDYERCESVYMDSLLRHGYIRKTENGYEPTIIVWTTEEPPFTDEERASLKAQAAAVRAMLADSAKMAQNTIKADLPKSHRENEHLCDFAYRNGGIDRAWVIEQAIADGWLTLDDNTSKTIGAHIQL